LLLFSAFFIFGTLFVNSVSEPKLKIERRKQ